MMGMSEEAGAGRSQPAVRAVTAHLAIAARQAARLIFALKMGSSRRDAIRPPSDRKFECFLSSRDVYIDA